MPQDDTQNLRQRKEEIRRQGHARRDAQQNKDELSRAICASLRALPEFATARTILFYLDARSEVRTRPLVFALLAEGKRVVVPYCVDKRLALFHLEDANELSLGAFEVLEPKAELRRISKKRVAPEEIDLVVAPGVAFDRQGGRLGHGLGYYDRLLEHVRPDAPLVALAYESQLVPEAPADAHDICMDKVITEQAVYLGRGRSK